ncbi:MAG: 1-aminocyclopropane-1-carboxylate deaminase [Arcticibacterium sp.]
MDFEKHFLSPTPLQKLERPIFNEIGIEVWLKRDEQTHPYVSGNKFRKLKYNLIAAKKAHKTTLLSFGGAYSNHIYALAAAAKLFGFNAEAIIRGHELNENSSPTLAYASKQGMKMQFVSRSDYRKKEALKEKFMSENHFYIPEGGSNHEALRGCSEMLDEVLAEIKPTHFCLSAGTGGTAAGVLSNSRFEGRVCCFPALKNGGFINEEVSALLEETPGNLELFTEYHFGGYGKTKPELLDFIKNTESEFQIKLEQVYTGKLIYGVFDLIQKGNFPFGSKIVIYHSGGLQGRLPALSAK